MGYVKDGEGWMGEMEYGGVAFEIVFFGGKVFLREGF